MRNYQYIDEYLNRLQEDIYPQPQDEGHTLWANQAVETFMEVVGKNVSVLDLGCGEAFLQEKFESYGCEYFGVCLGEDYAVAKSNGKKVAHEDFSFLSFEEKSFDFLFSRHSLEHSPIPLLTIMEWTRVTRKYIGLVLPAPEYWKWGGRNHYFVLNRKQWKNVFEAAHLDVVYECVKRHPMYPDKPESEIEYWFLLERR